MLGIYEIVNLADGKATAYVGSSLNIKKRWGEHVRLLRKGQHDNARLQNAWNKYGEGAFSFCVLEQVADREGLLGREQCFLNRAFEVGDTYNIVQDARCPPSRLGKTPWNKGKVGVSEETRRRLIESHTGHRHTEEHKRKISEALTGRPVSEETKRKIGEASKGNQHCLGRTVSEETRRKLGAAGARPYPAFIHRETGEIIPAGKNLTALYRERGLSQSAMCSVKNGKRNHHKGWELA